MTDRGYFNLVCGSCGAVNPPDLAEGGHVVPGEIPDLCGPVEPDKGSTGDAP